MSINGSQTGKLAPQTLLVQRYTIIRLAGRGGMSAIYQALDMRRNRQRVAVKEMSLGNLYEDEREEALARFQQEANLLGALNHPNLPRIYDAFSEGERSFLVMDYIDGKTLLQLLQETGHPLAVDQVMHYANQLCDVLAYLHQQNPPIIFRDLKPTNVMVTPAGHVYLIDFGIARFFKEGQSQDTTVLGSPGYAPPEQHGSGQTTPRSDLYALGATLHCCLTNRDPYHATDRFSFVPVRQLNRQVPEELERLVMRLLALDEKQRPTSAQEVKQALARVRQQAWDRSNSGHFATVPASSAPSAAMPTQYPRPTAPAYQPTQAALGQSGPQEKLILRPAGTPAAPPSAAGYRPAPYPARPPAYPPNGTPAPARAHVWTAGFVLLFFLMLILTVGGSTLAFNVTNPYGPQNTAGLDHATEAALVVIALLASLIIVVMARSFLAVLIILLSMVGILAAGAAFLLQTLRDLQPGVQILTQTPVNEMLTYGLLAAGIISIFWIFRRPFTWGDRFWLLLFFGAVCACAYLQMSYADNIVDKHLLLLGALIVFIQGIVMAGQMERKRAQV